MFKLHPFHSYQMCKKIHRNPISVSAQNLINDQREGREGAEVASVEVSSQVWTFHKESVMIQVIQVIDVVTGKGAPGVLPVNELKKDSSQFEPYRNTYQKQQQHQPDVRNDKRPYSQSNLNILNFPSQGEIKRPTLESIASHAAAQGREVTTPQQLLDMCCQFPACYDPLYQVTILPPESFPQLLSTTPTIKKTWTENDFSFASTPAASARQSSQ